MRRSGRWHSHRQCHLPRAGAPFVCVKLLGRTGTPLIARKHRHHTAYMRHALCHAPTRMQRERTQRTAFIHPPDTTSQPPQQQDDAASRQHVLVHGGQPPGSVRVLQSRGVLQIRRAAAPYRALQDHQGDGAGGHDPQRRRQHGHLSVRAMPPPLFPPTHPPTHPCSTPPKKQRGAGHADPGPDHGLVLHRGDCHTFVLHWAVLCGLPHGRRDGAGADVYGRQAPFGLQGVGRLLQLLPVHVVAGTCVSVGKKEEGTVPARPHQSPTHPPTHPYNRITSTTSTCWRK